MLGERMIVICPQCGAKNRIPAIRWGDRAVCGKCQVFLPLLNPFPDQPVEVSDENIKNEVVNFAGPVLLEFYAPWCGYCQRLSPILVQLAQEYAGRVKFTQLDVDKNTLTASQYSIRSTPSLFFFKRGKLVDKVLGAIPKEEIERRLRSLL